MRARSSLDRLANAGRPLLANADEFVDAGEQEQIFERIVVSQRRPAVRPRRQLVIALVAAVVMGAAVVAGATLGHEAPAHKTVGGHHTVTLTGAGLETAGYHFRTPAGFTGSSTTCSAASLSGTALKLGFSAAASADGGCIQAFFVTAGNPTTQPANSTAVDVGSYQGYYVAEGASEGKLYVELPNGDPSQRDYLVLFGQGLTEDELVAVAQSGLPESP
jgi:hypothetical protein